MSRKTAALHKKRPTITLRALLTSLQKMTEEALDKNLYIQGEVTTWRIMYADLDYFEGEEVSDMDTDEQEKGAYFLYIDDITPECDMSGPVKKE